MSTRSGKRIHSSFHENTLKPDAEIVVQIERKTRSKRCKDNVEELSVSVLKTKKRSNYVSYPTDDEVGAETVDTKEEFKPSRSLRKNALKEQNNITSSTESADAPTDVLKPVRTTRRTRKFGEDVEDTHDNRNHVEEVVNAGTKVKKEKKKKKPIPDEVAESIISKKKSKKKVKKAKRSSDPIEEALTKEPENNEKETLNRSNMSVDSFHSAAGSPFRHTAGNTVNIISPPKDFKATPTSNCSDDTAHQIKGRQTRSITRISHGHIAQSTPDSGVKTSRKRKSSFIDCNKTTTGNVSFDIDKELDEFDTTLTNTSKKRKSSIRDTVSMTNAEKTFDGENKHSVIDLEGLERRKSAIKAVINTTYDKSETPKSITATTLNKSGHLDDRNIVYEKSQTVIPKTQTPQPELNSTFEKTDKKSSDKLDLSKERAAINTTFEKDGLKINSMTRKSAIINTTYEKESDDINQDPKARKSSIINDIYNKDISADILSETEDINLVKSTQDRKLSTGMNSTYEKTEKSHSIFDQENKLDTTFDKNSKSSIISSDNSTFEKVKKLDTTFDKNSKSSLISSDNSNISDRSDVSRISITSDDSKENIINTTPVLIESSLDESQMNSSKLASKSDDAQNASKLKSPSETTKISPLTAPITPLKREGTFTKDGSDITEIQSDLLRTPTRKMSLPSPGYTPFRTFNSKDKTMINVMRSLEKSRRSSLAEPVSRTTRVMFCSPVNNPVVVDQQRRKVIKSNLKGSNKSFVFEDAEPRPRAAPRKRSFTHNDAEEARAKRNRLASTSLGRLSRPRTTSATAKLTEPGTSSKKSTVTPTKPSKVSRTKLPDFAALHRREFSKMESLDECQERKARRARLLLTPTGAVAVLDRGSPRETIEPTSNEAKKSPNLQKEDPNEQTSAKRSKEPKKPATPIKSLPTLKSLNSGYTRFGFKLNYDVNPFSINNKIDNNCSQTCSSKKNTAKKDLTRPLKELKGLKRQATLPSLTGTTSAREVAKQTVMREKSFTEKRNKTRNENRTVIKGVRTNRRFELQMRMRNLE